MLVKDEVINQNPEYVTLNVLLKDKNDVEEEIKFFPIKTLETLESDRISWEKGAYKASNEELYDILGTCLAFCGELELSKAKKRSAALERFYKERNYKYKKDLPLATRVVRAVFGELDRRRISTYSIVIRQAQKDKVLFTNLGDWIKQKGGIQEITLSQSSTFVSPKQKAEIGKEAIKNKIPIGFAKSELLSKLADADHLGEMCVLLAEQQSDGGFGVYAVLRQDSLVNAAFATFYSSQREATTHSKAEVNAANDADGAVAKSA